MFQWAAGVQRDQEEVLEACDQGALHRLADLEEDNLAEGRGAAAEDRDRDVAEEAEADHRLRIVAVAANPAVSRRYAPGRMPVIVPRRV